MIKIFHSNGYIEVDSTKDYFPDGTPAFNSIRNYERDVTGTCMIQWLFDNMGELFEVIAINDWLRSNPNVTSIKLIMPYIPNARMDRVKSPKDVFTLKTFCNLINGCKFNEVYVKSAHSYVSLALLNNVINWEPIERMDLSFYDSVFFPDEGALKRFSELDCFKNKALLFANKKRDWKTGRILGLDVVGDEEDIKGKKILFVDDLISRGGSLLYSTKELFARGAILVDAFITHTENVIDVDSLKEVGVGKIYTTDSIYRGDSDLIKVVHM